MSITPERSRLAASWVDNADAWTTAVRTGAIASRRAGTDRAIMEAIAHAPDGPLIDLGCGEGWLARCIAEGGRRVVGVDASAPLVDAARLASEAAGPRFEQVTYAELASRANELGAPFAIAVCNFALLDDKLGDALTAIASVLEPQGTLLIQTVHPFTACGEGPYADGWREETFDAFGGRFPSAMPWYFRTIGSWMAELRAAGFAVASVEEPKAAAFAVTSVAEPKAPDGSMPLSLLVTAHRNT